MSTIEISPHDWSTNEQARPDETAELIELQQNASILDILRARVHDTPDQPALILIDNRARESKTFTYRKLATRINTLVSYVF